MPIRRRVYPIQDFKVSIDTSRKIAEGGHGIVYRGRITRSAEANARRFTIPVAIKLGDWVENGPF